MKNKKMIGGIVAIAMMLVVVLACNQHGTKLEFNGGELYYTDNVTEAEAKKLGEYLVKETFFDGQKKSVQLDKSGSTYQFRMVVKKELQNDDSFTANAKVAATEISENVFNKAPTEVHICDENLKTIRVVKP
jgi:hypothetical protein